MTVAGAAGITATAIFFVVFDGYRIESWSDLIRLLIFIAMLVAIYVVNNPALSRKVDAWINGEES